MNTPDHTVTVSPVIEPSKEQYDALVQDICGKVMPTMRSLKETVSRAYPETSRDPMSPMRRQLFDSAEHSVVSLVNLMKMPTVPTFTVRDAMHLLVEHLGQFIDNQCHDRTHLPQVPLEKKLFAAKTLIGALESINNFMADFPGHFSKEEVRVAQEQLKHAAGIQASYQVTNKGRMAIE